MDQHLVVFSDFCKAKRAGRSASATFDHLGEWVNMDRFLQEAIDKDPKIRYESVSEKLRGAFDPGLLARAHYRIVGYISGFTQELGRSKYCSFEEAMRDCKRVAAGGVTKNLKRGTFEVRKGTVQSGACIVVKPDGWHEVSWLAAEH